MKKKNTMNGKMGSRNNHEGKRNSNVQLTYNIHSTSVTGKDMSIKVIRNRRLARTKKVTSSAGENVGDGRSDV